MAKSLESQVRGALIERTSNELYEQFSTDPKYKKMIAEFAEELGSSMIEIISSKVGDIKDEEKAEMFEKYKEEITAEFDNPKKLKQMVNQQAENQYTSLRRFKAKLKPQFKKMGEDEEMNIDKAAMEGFEKSFEEFFQYFEINDKLVKKLTEIAKEEGLEVAAKKETTYRVIKEMFPTANDYRTYVKKGFESMKEFFKKAEGSLMADGEGGQFMGSMIGAMRKAVEKLVKINGFIQEGYLEKTTKEIYKTD